jgi:hypothetical protein
VNELGIVRLEYRYNKLIMTCKNSSQCTRTKNGAVIITRAVELCPIHYFLLPSKINQKSSLGHVARVNPEQLVDRTEIMIVVGLDPHIARPAIVVDDAHTRPSNATATTRTYSSERMKRQLFVRVSQLCHGVSTRERKIE